MQNIHKYGSDNIHVKSSSRDLFRGCYFQLQNNALVNLKRLSIHKKLVLNLDDFLKLNHFILAFVLQQLVRMGHMDKTVTTHADIVWRKVIVSIQMGPVSLGVSRVTMVTCVKYVRKSIGVCNFFLIIYNIMHLSL